MDVYLPQGNLKTLSSLKPSLELNVSDQLYFINTWQICNYQQLHLFTSNDQLTWLIQ